LSLVVLSYSEAGAQNQISIQPTPKPDQTLHVATTQEFSMTIDSGAPAKAMHISNKGAIAFTQTNERSANGDRIDSQITLERIEIEETINGSKKTPDDAGKFVGQSLTATFDRAGKIVNIKMPKELQRTTTRLRSPVSAAYGGLITLPDATFSIGQSVTIPWDMPMRMPESGTETPYKVQTVITLRAIEKKGKDRVAHFVQRIQSTGQTDQLKVTGAGTIDLNLDRGFVAASTIEWTATGTVRPKGSPADAQPSNVRATMKATTNASE
jgi:hypothetical protein